jgi:hypothetical protein
LIALADEERGGTDDNGACAEFGQGKKCSIDLAFSTDWH